jgi:hypothetical protein
MKTYCFDIDTKKYLNRVNTFRGLNGLSNIAMADSIDIDNFVVGLKDLGIWHVCSFWMLRSQHNIGTGSTALFNGGSFGGCNLTMFNSMTWSVSGIVKSGLVYVGYQSDDTRTFNNSSEEFSPKGSASLNVASSDTSTTTTRDSEALISAGKALNIQQGDIVSRNADAGWIEVNLTTVGISGGGTSQILQCWDNSSNRSARISGSGVTPKWLLRYKVIGYTVHFIASLEGVIWRTTLSGSDAQLVFINAANNLFGTTPSTSLMPRPKAGNTSTVYSTLNNYTLPGTNRSQSFHGTGTLILRNSQANWPVNGAGIGGIGVVTPIEAAWDNVNNRISIFKNGSPAILPNSSSSAPLNAYDPQLISNVLSFRNYLIPLNGGEIAGGTSVASNVDVWTDIYFSGTYELDPQYWYGTYNP